MISAIMKSFEMILLLAAATVYLRKEVGVPA